MKVLLKPAGIVLVPENPDEEADLTAWRETHGGHVLLSIDPGGGGLLLRDLGPRPEVCREPIAIASRVASPEWRRIGNFAPAPFDLDGRHYANVEAFWQGLKFSDESDRRRVAQLPGPEARRAGDGDSIEYEGRTFVPGTWEHWQLMRRACEAKFDQNPEAAAALLATGNRPLVHRLRRDSRTIPGALMAEIWMSIRARLAAARG